MKIAGMLSYDATQQNISYEIRNVLYHRRKASRRSFFLPSDIKKTAGYIPHDFPEAPKGAGHRSGDSNIDFYDKTAAIMRPRLERTTSRRNFQASHQSVSPIPLWVHGLSTKTFCEYAPNETMDRRLQKKLVS